MYRTLNECAEAVMKDKDILKNNDIDIYVLNGAYNYYPYSQQTDGSKGQLYARINRSRGLPTHRDLNFLTAEARLEVEKYPLPAHLMRQ